MKKSLLTLLSIGILLLLWQLFALTVDLPELVPSIPKLVGTLAGLFTSATFYQSVAATVARGIGGMLISLAAAICMAYLFSRKEWLYELFRPMLAIMRSIPVISFILLALIFLNPENIPLIIAFLTMFPLLTENLTKGIRNQRKEYMIMARTFQIGRWNRITQIIYPQLKPFLYSGLASAAGFGWRAIIMGEVLAQCNLGIGGEMKRAQTFIAVPELMAWTIVAILVSFLFDKGIARLGQMPVGISYTSKEKEMPSPMPVGDIRIKDLSFQYGDKPILSHFNYQFKQGHIYGITAPSGTGKTTLLQLIGHILHPLQGKIEMNDCGGIATVFQEPELLNHLTVAENIALPLAAVTGKEKALALAAGILEEMEMETYGERFPGELSFGQQQRVAMARALIYPSSLLLMDEPFKGIDEALCRRIIGRIRQRQSESGQTVLFTSHNPEELQLLADETVRLKTD